MAADYPDDRIGIEVGDRAVIDVLRVRLRPGVTGVDRFIRLGAGVRIGLIDVEAAGQTERHDEQQDGFLQIRGADVRIDALRFKNIDRCVLVQRRGAALDRRLRLRALLPRASSSSAPRTSISARSAPAWPRRTPRRIPATTA